MQVSWTRLAHSLICFCLLFAGRAERVAGAKAQVVT
jgi:hypothetical protein